MEKFFFYLCASMAVLGALSTVTRRNTLESALSLVFAFIGVAGLYFLNDAPFAGALQVLVYAGAIMVLFIFVIMLLNLQDHELGEPKVTLFKIISALIVASVAFTLVGILGGEDLLAPIQDELAGKGLTEAEMGTFGSLKAVGVVLFNKYLLPFELTSILLLVAMVGAVILAKRDPRSTWISEEERTRTQAERHGNMVSRRGSGR